MATHLQDNTSAANDIMSLADLWLHTCRITSERCSLCIFRTLWLHACRITLHQGFATCGRHGRLRSERECAGTGTEMECLL